VKFQERRYNMEIRKHEGIVIIDAEPGKYLAIPRLSKSERLLGRPERIVIKDTGHIPEFEEREVIE
jgi:hypothetical protein